MKKKFIKSVLLGFPVGIAVYFTTCLIYSIVFGDGTLHMTDDILITFWGSEVNAVIYHVLY